MSEPVYELRIGRNDNRETIVMQGFTAAEVITAARFFSRRPCAVGIHRGEQIVGLADRGDVQILIEAAGVDLLAAIAEEQAS